MKIPPSHIAFLSVLALVDLPLVGLPLVGLPLSGCVVAPLFVDGNGVSQEETRDVAAFTRIQNGSELEVLVSIGTPQSVRLTCDENLLPYVKTRIDGDQLEIDVQDAQNGWVSIQPHTPCNVHIQLPELRGAILTGSGDMNVSGSPLAPDWLEDSGSGNLSLLAPVVAGALEGVLSGSGNISLVGIEVDELSLEDSGSGRFQIAGPVDAAQISLRSSGSGDVELEAGIADELELISSGSGGVDTQGVEASRVTATLSGSGSGRVTALESLEAHLSGSGSLYVYGAPASTTIQSTGSGTVHIQ